MHSSDNPVVLHLATPEEVIEMEQESPSTIREKEEYEDSKKCNHEVVEVIASIEGLEVSACSFCHKVFGVEGVLEDAEYTEYILRSYYRRADYKFVELNRKIEDYLKENLSEKNYERWREVSDRFHTFAIQRSKGNPYLKLSFYSENRQKKTISFGRAENYPDLEQFLEWRLKRIGYKRLRDYLMHTIKIIRGEDNA